MLPVEVSAYLFHHPDPWLRLRFHLILQCAPFFKGLKVASLISLEEKMQAGLSELLEGTGISWRRLAVKRGKAVILLYRSTELEEYVNRPEIRRILKKAGYRRTELGEMLDHLSARMDLPGKGQSEFPHEIGVFLGYPAEDVKSFMEKEGKECLSVGYWKVYHDMPQAVRTFHAFDDAKVYAVNEFLTGKSLREILQEEV